MPDVLTAPHSLEYTYTRSTGPVIGEFLGALREQKVLGIRDEAGRVLVPPTEYDPYTSNPLSELVEVGTEGVVTTWSWNSRPLAGQPLAWPFAWALVQLDGADTALLGAVDVVGPEAMSTGMRVRIRWADERTGSIRDIACFEPITADAGAVGASVAQPKSAAGGGAGPAPMTQGDVGPDIVQTPIKLDYTYTPGVAASRFLRSIAEGKLLGQRCTECGKVYVPPRGACSMCGAPTDEEVVLAGPGTVTTFAAVSLPSPNLPSPYVVAWILIDGADITSMFLIQEVDAAEVHLGMRVEPVWVEASERKMTLENIRYYRPNGEPDADYSTYKDYV